LKHLRKKVKGRGRSRLERLKTLRTPRWNISKVFYMGVLLPLMTSFLLSNHSSSRFSQGGGAFSLPLHPLWAIGIQPIALH